MSKNRKGRRQGETRSTPPYSKLDQHQRHGATLTPPLMAIPNLKPTSWLHERLPDMLWCALLVAHFERNTVLELFREVALLGRGRFESGYDFSLTHTGIMELPGDLGEQIVRLICEDPEPREVLRALLLLEDLPAREVWALNIGEEPQPTDWEVLAIAVGQALDQQSQEATDCRWASVLFRLLGGQLHVRTVEEANVLWRYPEREEEISGRIRAIEGAENPSRSYTSRQGWVESFWRQCLRETGCEPIRLRQSQSSIVAGTTMAQVAEVRAELVRHSARTMSSSYLDARHESTFGIAAYSLDIVRELLQVGVGSNIIGRTGLRALLETYITLAYLAHRDAPDLWMAYRNYGVGQAKLAFLKSFEDTELPMAIDPSVLETIANEDRWQEFVSINLGHWEKANLRVMSESAGVKGMYDRYYPWTSAFTHGNWAAVRNAEYDVCGNPLHRLHRILRDAAAQLEDVVSDACQIADSTLALVDQLYPRFANRISIPAE